MLLSLVRGTAGQRLSRGSAERAGTTTAPGPGADRFGGWLPAGSGGGELPVPDGGDERRPGGRVEHERRAVRVLAVTDGDHAARGDEVGGDLYAGATVVAVGGLEPTRGFGRHGVPFRN